MIIFRKGPDYPVFQGMIYIVLASRVDPGFEFAYGEILDVNKPIKCFTRRCDTLMRKCKHLLFCQAKL